MLRKFVCLSVLGIFTATASAQGLRVSTVVYDASRLDASGKEPVLSRSLSLFHNGRAYDFVESAGEVVILEKTARRFVVLNSGRGIFTTVPFAQIQQMLQTREPKMQQYLRELTAQDSPQAEQAARMLEFQLSPKFETQFSDRSGILTLSSPSWKYSVSTRPWEDEEQIEKYLDYTDWTAQLNYILHPSSMFPEPRLALNAELRKRKSRIPVVVQLDLRPDERTVLRAEHQFVRNLTEKDLQLIGNWNKALKDGSLKMVPLLKYQETILVSQSRR